MSLLKIFDLVDEKLNPSLVFEGLENFCLSNKFYKQIPVLKYYTHDFQKANLDEDDLKYFFVFGWDCVKEISLKEGFSSSEYSAFSEKSMINYLNQKLGMEIKDYENLIYLKKISDYDSKYVNFEEELDNIQENIFEADVEVFYSPEVRDAIVALKGESLEDVNKLNDYLMGFYKNIRDC